MADLPVSDQLSDYRSAPLFATSLTIDRRLHDDRRPYVRRGDCRQDTSGMVGDRADFFVSHAGADRAWAEWVAWQLTEAGYTR